jgi:hypothetical protein
MENYWKKTLNTPILSFVKKCQIINIIQKVYYIVTSSVAELHHFYAAPGNNFDAAPAAPAPAPTLLYSKANFLKRT